MSGLSVYVPVPYTANTRAVSIHRAARVSKQGRGTRCEQARHPKGRWIEASRDALYTSSTVLPRPRGSVGRLAK